MSMISTFLPVVYTQCGNMRKLLLLEKYFAKSIIIRVIYVGLNKLISRNFCHKLARLNFRNFHTVLQVFVLCKRNCSNVLEMNSNFQMMECPDEGMYLLLLLFLCTHVCVCLFLTKLQPLWMYVHVRKILVDESRSKNVHI